MHAWTREWNRSAGTTGHPRGRDGDGICAGRLPPTIQGTWGSVLIETGSLQEGIQHVLEAYEHSEISRSQATNLAYAAIGYHRLGDAEKAAELFQKARSLDESVYTVKKARAELGLSNGSESLTKTASSTA